MVLTKEIEMGYSFTMPKGIAFRVKKEGIYPWPRDGDKDRTIELFTDDVLTKQENGKYMKHTGLFLSCLCGSELEVYPPNHLIFKEHSPSEPEHPNSWSVP